jgi:hypothetical protein
MSPGFIYWIYFDKTGRPEKIVAPNAEELSHRILELTMRTGEMPEWIIRGYK